MIGKYGHYYLEKKSLKSEEYYDLRGNFCAIVPKSDSAFGKKAYNLWREAKNYIILPRNFAIERYGIPERNALKSGARFPDLNQGLKIARPYQEKAIEAIIEAARGTGRGRYGGILKMGTGGGKTWTSLETARRIGRRTLIVVDKRNNVEIFAREIENSWSGAKWCTLNEYAAMSQKERNRMHFIISVHKSIALKKYPADLFLDFGFVIIDEIHTMITAQYVTIFDYISRRFILGLSATPTRADKTDFLIDWYIGPILHEIMDTYHGKPIRIQAIRLVGKEYSIVMRKDKNGLDAGVSFADTLRPIIFNDARHSVIMNLMINKMHYERENGIDPGQWLILCNQVDYINEIAAYLERNIAPTFDTNVTKFYSGYNDYDESARIICGIRALCGASFNVPNLRYLVIACPVRTYNDGENAEALQQIVGRVTRRYHETSPIIFDIVDNNSILIKHWSQRREYYKNCGYVIQKETINVE